MAGAADFRLIPSIDQQLQYSDNIFFQPNHQIHDYKSYTVGGLRLLDKTETLTLDTQAQVAQSLYEHSTGLNSTDVLSHGTASYSLTPKLNLSGRAAYNRDSQPDQELATTGLILYGLKREFYTYGATTGYQMTPLTQASLSYDHGVDHYYPGPAAPGASATATSDQTYDTAGLSFQRDLTKLLPLLNGLLNLNYARYSYTTTEVNSYEATTGFNYALHEKWSVQLTAGGRRTDSTFDTFLGKTTNTGYGYVGNASVNYKGEATTGTFTVGRDISPSSGQSGPVERTSFTLSANRKFTYEFSGLFSASYFINRSNGGGLSATPLNQDTFSFSPGVHYDFNNDMYLEGTYTYARVKDNEAGTTANRNLFLLRFFVQHAILE